MEYLGNLFRATLDVPARKTDYQVRSRRRLPHRPPCYMLCMPGAGLLAQHPTPCCHSLRQALLPTCTVPRCRWCVQVGEQLLRDLVFIHLDSPADKLQLTVQMLLKLYALVSGAAPPLQPALASTGGQAGTDFHAADGSPLFHR